MQVPDYLVKHARQFPAKTALVDLHSGRRVSYSQLNERASRFAEYLRDRWQVKPGDRVALLAHSSSDYVEMLYGCGKIGAVVICLNWRLSVDELKGVLGDATPTALVWGEEFDAAGTALMDAFKLKNCMVTGAARAQVAGYESALAEMSGAAVEMPWREHNDVWYLLYTAGSTGKPKGVPQTWGMNVTNTLTNTIHVSLRRDDVMLSVLPYFHTGGLNLYMNCMLMLGATTLIMRQFDVDKTMELLEKEATVMFGVPAIYLFLSQHPRFAGADFSRVRSWAAGGAPVPRVLLEQYLAKGVTICFGFGMTETGPTVFLTDEDTARRKVGTVGKPVMFVEAKVVDTQTRQKLGANQRGEMLLRGPAITPGYWNNPEATAKSFEDGWLCTGDIVYFDDDGDFYVVDRSKDMYISGGENVYPAEVENVIFQIEGVAEAAVIGIHDVKWGEVGKAIVALKPGAQVSEEQVIAYCKQKLAGFKAPKQVQFVPALARNAAGKVDKPRLRAEFGDKA